MVELIVKGSSETKNEDDNRTENNNGIFHIKCAFSNELNIQTDEDLKKFISSKNVNGWTPSFYAIFKGTKLIQDKLYNSDDIDYFGNPQSFYTRK